MLTQIIESVFFRSFQNQYKSLKVAVFALHNYYSNFLEAWKFVLDAKNHEMFDFKTIKNEMWKSELWK